MDSKAIDTLINQLQAAASVASGKGNTATAPKGPGFGELLKTSLDQVNDRQQAAMRLAKDYELGSPSVNLQDVMIASAKANVSFQATVQVRNRLVSAYHDIMNMQM